MVQVLEKIIADISSKLTDNERGSDDQIHLPTLIQDLEKHPSMEAINILCKKISVKKKLWINYPLNWIEPKNKKELPSFYWVMLIALFLLEAKKSLTEKEKIGFGLKCLNTALLALDICGNRIEKSLFSDLKTHSMDIIASYGFL